MGTIIDALAWRYATKKFTQKRLTDEQLHTMLEAARLAPTSFGLQPFKIVVVNDPEIRKQLRAAAWDQAQVTDASHLFVFAVPTDLGDPHVDKFIQVVAKTRSASVESLAGYSQMIKGAVASKSPEQRVEWAARQAYIALGVMLTAGALEQIDMAPLEGFDPKKFDEILGLSAQSLTSVVMVAAGFRADDDSYAALTKVRFAKEDLVIEK